MADSTSQSPKQRYRSVTSLSRHAASYPQFLNLLIVSRLITEIENLFCDCRKIRWNCMTFSISVRSDRQRNTNRRAAAWTGFDFDSATVRFDHAGHHRQTQTG